SSEPERARRAELCLKRIGQAKRPLPPEAARLLALRRPAGAAGVLLDYLPFADDEAMVAEVQTALAVVALNDGEPDGSLLAGLAGERAPDVFLGSDEAGRAKWRAAWAAWWKDNAAMVSLVRGGAPPLLGLTLIAQMSQNGQGRVIEVGRDGKIRWQVGGLQNP